jgi:hypothetical protein
VYGETTNEFLFSTDITNDGEDNKSLTPEELARKCCLQFLNEVYNVIGFNFYIINSQEL